MFCSVSITGFRGFRSLKIGGLNRFNLFLGRNNVGKTAVLEAFFLMAGPTNPHLPLQVNIFRGIDQFRFDPEELWGWLFNSEGQRREIVVEVDMEDHKKRTLKIKLGRQSQIRLANRRKQPSGTQRASGTASTTIQPAELLLDYESETGRHVKTKAFVSERGIGLQGSRAILFPSSVFVSARGGYSPENPERFSSLQRVGRENEIVRALQVLEPRLKKMSVLVGGGGPIIHGDIGLGRMVPVPMMGEGVGRLLTILLAISASKDGSVMVDEVENGFHYSVLEKVWTAVANLVRETNVQLFAATHSWECLKAAHESFLKSDQYDFRLHRLDMSDEAVVSTMYDKMMIETALSSGLELR
jgi:hypothetical protein